jgi:altronate dehydratase
MEQKTNSLIVSPTDDVAVTIKPLSKGDTALFLKDGMPEQLVLLSDIPVYHKFALHDIKPGENITKYGQIIGFATAPIKRGEHVHIHNIKGTGDKS